jgi:4-aminobutyrate aminotransferase-like enzyme
MTGTGARTHAYTDLAARYDADFDPTIGRPVIERGYGAILVDVEGHESIDLSDIVANVGHCHPRHVAALQDAAGRMLTGKSGGTNPARAELVKRLVEMSPLDHGKAYLVASGSEAIDWAMRIARRATGKHEILTFWGGVYGRTYGAMSLNGLMRRRRFGPMLPGIVHAPYPNCYRCPFGKNAEDCGFFCIDFLDETLEHASTGDVAALVVEPYQGVGGMVFPPDGYLTRLRQWAAERGIVFILDEVQSSIGRTGKLLALEWEGLEPDMIVLGKGLGSGVGVAAVVAESWLFDALDPGELGGGNGGNPLACTSALTVLDIVESERLPDHANEVGHYLLDRFRGWLSVSDVVGDVRGKGLALAIEFVKDRATKEPYPEIVRDIARRAYPEGIYVSARSHVLDVRPPLVITRAQAERAADVLESALRASIGATS